jgi:hypothetical protein
MKYKVSSLHPVDFKTLAARTYFQGIVLGRFIVDPGLDVMVESKVHLLLFSAIDRFCDSTDVVFNYFRILTKICGPETVRTELLENYVADGPLNTFLFLIDKHTNHMQILSRLCYVLPDF